MANSNSTTVGGIKVTRTAGVAITSSTVKRFVKLSAANTVILCTSGVLPDGVALEIADLNDDISIGTIGEYLVEVGAGGVTMGTEVMSDGTGKAVSMTAVTATVPAGAVAVTSSGAQPAMTIVGGALPVKRAGIAIDTVAANGFARVRVF